MTATTPRPPGPSAPPAAPPGADGQVAAHGPAASNGPVPPDMPPARPPSPEPPGPATVPAPVPPAVPPGPVPPEIGASRLARLGVAVVVFGFFIFLIGIFPEIVRLGLTPGVGLAQTAVFLFGIAVMTLGGYTYAYATRHRAMPRRLREDIGVRLMATGLVAAYACGFADTLGIGSHFGAERPLLGPVQALGIAGSVLVVVLGLMLYARR